MVFACAPPVAGRILLRTCIFPVNFLYRFCIGGCAVAVSAFHRPQGAAPFRGSGAKRRRGLRGRTWCRWEKTVRTPTILFPIGNPSAMATPQSPAVTAPLRGAPRAWTKPPRSAEGVSGVGHGADGKRQDAVPTILFPIGSPSAMATPQSRYRSTAPLRGAPRAELLKG